MEPMLSMEFQPTDQGASFIVPLGSTVSLGRQPQYKLTNPRISRQHVELTVQQKQQQQQQAELITCTCRAHKKVEVQRGTCVFTLKCGQQFQLLPGDILYLIREGSEVTAGFHLAPAKSSSNGRHKSASLPAAAAAGAALCGKRTRADRFAAPAGIAVAVAATATAGSSCTVAAQDDMNKQPVAGAATAATGQLSSRAGSGSGGLAEQQQIFAGVQFCAWDNHHTQQAVKLATRAGAKLQSQLNSHTTHVIALFGLTQEELLQHQQASREGHVKQPQHSHASAAPAAAAAAVTGPPVVVVDGSPSGMQLCVTRQLQLEGRTPTEGQSEEGLEGYDGTLVPQQPADKFAVNGLAPGVKFVTVRWLTDSLAAGRMLPEDSYYIHLQRCQQQQQQSAALSRAARASAAGSGSGAMPAAKSVAAVAVPSGATAPAVAAPNGIQKHQQLTSSVTAVQQLSCRSVPGAVQQPGGAAASRAAATHLFANSEEEWAQPGTSAANTVRCQQQHSGLTQQQQQQQQRLGCQQLEFSGSPYAQLTLRLDEGEEEQVGRPAGGKGDLADAVLIHSMDGHEREACQEAAALPEMPLGNAAHQGPCQQEQQQQQLCSIVAPRPDQVCRPGEAWGAGGRWIEQWDEGAARDTIEQLLAHWHRFKYQGKRRAQQGAATPAEPAAAAGYPHEGQSGDEDDCGLFDGASDSHSGYEGPDRKRRRHHKGATAAAGAAAAAAPINTVCGHIACSEQLFCFVHEMERMKATYRQGRRDEFRVRAATRAICTLELLAKPIVVPEDVTGLSLGPKTSDKLLELLNTGQLRRTEVLEGSEYNKIMALFSGVWGVAESTAERWYQAGCRTLEDVKAKVTNLSVMQQVGLCHYEDFNRRIPRLEVEEAEAIITEAGADALQRLSCKPRSEVLHMLHARAMGSFARGKLDCGDIDFIISPGPECRTVGLGPLLAAVLQHLAERGYITQDMLPLEHQRAPRGPDERVSWMGVYRGPSSPCYRRLDVKIYPRSMLALAVNYFASGQDMCRALRHWCNRPTPQVAALAAALNSTGNAFRLGDRELVVIHRTYTGKASSGNGDISKQQSTGPAAAAPAAAAGDEEHGDAADLQQAQMDTTTTVKLGDSRMGLSGKSTTVRETVVGPAIKCSCETDIFKAIGLAYVPPHLRNLMSRGML